MNGVLTGLAGTAVVLLFAAGCDSGSGPTQSDTGARSATGIGVEVATLGAEIDHPYVAFAAVRRTVYVGEEADAETGDRVALRVESEVRDEPARVAGVDVTVVDVRDFEDDELVEETEDYYAQGTDGTVYYLGERVDEYEDGEPVGHGGQWLAGENGSLAGVFMPPNPAVGDDFEQERAPGVAEDESSVIEAGLSVTVPAGTFEDCIKTKDVDPLDGATEHKIYCPGVGLVREIFSAGGTLDLVELVRR